MADRRSVKGDDRSGGDATETEKIARNAWDKVHMNKAYDLTRRDAVALSVITAAAIGVRLWRISWPDEVVLREAHVGKKINRYITGEFAFDVHPPLGTLLMAGIGALTRYNGTFDFDEIGNIYPVSLPYISMRLSMALMGALCAPMAYVTLKSAGHSAPAAIIASTLVTFDNAMLANNRLLGLDAPLMFFTAATAMFWNLFKKHSPSPFSSEWWGFLLATSLSMTGAMSVKLAGVLNVVLIWVFTLSTLCAMAMDESVNAMQWFKHFTARVVVLAIIPSMLYTVLSQVHFSRQTYEPANTASPHAAHDLSLSKSLRHSLVRKQSRSSPDDISWSDIVYGSVVQLQNEDTASVYVHSVYNNTPTESKQQQLEGYQYPDINTHWIVIRAGKDMHNDGEIPSRLQYVKNRDLIQLRHVPTRRCLHSSEARSFSDGSDSLKYEVTAYGAPGYHGDLMDWWEVEMVDVVTGRIVKKNEERVKALETTFRLKHVNQGCYLFATNSLLPDPWGKGRHEIVCRREKKIRPKAIWRFTMNKHDYLPYDTPVASYKPLPYWQKFSEIHRLMWSHVGFEQSTPQAAAEHPIHWPLGQSMSHAWSGYMRHITIIANPVVWGTSLVGLIAFAILRIFFIMREKREYFETGNVRDFKRFHMNDAGTYFTGWAICFLPFFFVDRQLLNHHYYPALYYSILLTSCLITGISSFVPRGARLMLLLGLVILAVWTFVQLSPLSYGSALHRERCESVSRWANLINPRRNKTNDLDCTLFAQSGKYPQSMIEFTDLKKRDRQDRILRQQDPDLKTKVEYPAMPSNAPGIGSEANGPDSGGRQPSVEKQRPKVPRPEAKKNAPVVQWDLPASNQALPMDHLLMVGPQLPPQLRDTIVDV